MNAFKIFVKLASLILILGTFYMASAYVNLTWDPMEFGPWTRIVDAVVAMVVLWRVVTHEVKA
jgi:hypothetical protein